MCVCIVSVTPCGSLCEGVTQFYDGVFDVQKYGMVLVLAFGEAVVLCDYAGVERRGGAVCDPW